MEDKRTFNRWCTEREKSAATCAGVTEEVKMVDIGAGGMRVTSSRPLDYGATVYGQFEILPQLGPYYVKGTITRVTEADGSWDTAVKFDKISTIPLYA